MVTKGEWVWDTFNETQSAIEELEPEDENEASHHEERNIFESRYFSVTVDLETLIDNKTEDTRPTRERISIIAFH